MSARTVFAKCFLVLCATIVFLGLCEFTFKMAGAFAAHSIFPASEKFRPEADLICLGNSHTAGVGAPTGRAYCNQLEELALAKKIPVKAGNWGVSLFNTSDILNDLNKKLPLTNPRIALVMAGEANFFNFRGLREYLRAHDQEHLSPGEKFVSFIQKHSSTYRFFSLLRQQKTEFDYKPFPLEAVDPADRLAPAYRMLSWGRTFFPEEELNREKAKSLIGDMDTILHSDPDNLAAGLLKAEITAVALKDSDLALREFRDLPESVGACLAFLDIPKLEKKIDPNDRSLLTYFEEMRKLWAARYNPHERELIGHAVAGKIIPITSLMATYQIRSEESRDRVLEILAELNRCGYSGGRIFYGLVDYFTGLKQYFRLAGLMEDQLRFFPLSIDVDVFNQMVFIEDLSKKDHQLQNRFAAIKANYAARFGRRLLESVAPSYAQIEGWTESGLGEIIGRLRAKNIDVVLMNYPPMPLEKANNQGDLPGRQVDQIIKRVALARGVRFFDTYNILREQFMKTDFRGYYSFQMGPLDSHLNERGYRVLSENLLDFLEKEGLLKPRTIISEQSQ
jgi:hypothetical protein